MPRVYPKVPELCAVIGCERVAKVMGLCGMHYQRKRTHGDPLILLRVAKYSTSCSVAGCLTKARKRGWCNKHYSRWQAYGSPYVTERTPSGEPFEYLQHTLATRDRSECWEWPYACSDGYGQIVLDGHKERVTHVVLKWDGRAQPLSPSDNALHSCDNPSCFNPAHLRWGSNADNIQDKIDRQRTGVKLTAEQVQKIILDKRSHKAIAEEYEVTASNVSCIKRRITWRHIT
jgi:hypothetical protein